MPFDRVMIVFSLRSPASYSTEARRLVGCWAASHVDLMLLVLRFSCFHISSYSLCRYGSQRRARSLVTQHHGQTQLPILSLSLLCGGMMQMPLAISRSCFALSLRPRPMRLTRNYSCHDQRMLSSTPSVHVEAQQIIVFGKLGPDIPTPNSVL